MNYAKKVYQNKNESILSDLEIEHANEAFIGNKSGEEGVVEFTQKRKIVYNKNRILSIQERRK